MTRVYVDMVADIFHFGHVAFLKKASAFGDELIVGIMSDAEVRAHKRVPIMTMAELSKRGATKSGMPNQAACARPEKSTPGISPRPFPRTRTSP